MKNILILTSEYCGKAKANGICAKALADDFEDKNISVYIVSADFEKVEDTGSEKIKSVYVSKVENKTKKRSKLFYAFRLLKNMTLYSHKVNYNKDMANLMLAEAENICREVPIDAVICMYFPMESVIVGSRLKRNHKNLNFIVYELDSVADGIAGSGKYNKYMLNASKKTLKKMYKECDRVMIMDCHKSYWIDDFSEYKDKMMLTDLPLLTPSHMPNKKMESDTGVRFVYAGNLDSAYRSPYKLIETFKNINSNNWTIDFFSRGCEDDLEKFINCYEKARIVGYVERSVLNSEIEKTNILLSIGNKVSNSLPSKIITYMSYGKPIIHFCLQDNDVCKNYLKKYPLSLIIENNEDAAVASQKVIDFVRLNSEKKVRFDEVCSVFSKNLPSYSTGMILDYISNKEKIYSE